MSLSAHSLKVITIPPRSGESPQGNIVVMHGWGANAEDAAYFTQMLNLPEMQILLPEAPFPHPMNPVSGRMWYGFPPDFDFSAQWSHLPDLQASRKLLLAWLSQLPETTGIPLERTILGGFSQGGAMTLEVGFELPLAGLMVLSGYRHGAIAASPTQTTPMVLMVHGGADPIVPITAAQETATTLKQAGVPLRYEEFEDMGHEVSMTVLNRMEQFVGDRLGG
ncbi:MAG: alpha/beta hydrolase [Synechococcales bacterium]|nr:alpha/beta hydrolase [Synechococcales bacterium]